MRKWNSLHSIGNNSIICLYLVASKSIVIVLWNWIEWKIGMFLWGNEPECIFKITYSFGFVFVACAVKTLCRTIWKSISKSMEKKGTKHWEKWCCQQRSREYVADCVCVCVRAIVLNSMMWYSWPSLTQGNEYSAFLIRISYMGEMKHNFNPW